MTSKVRRSPAAWIPPRHCPKQASIIFPCSSVSLQDLASPSLIDAYVESSQYRRFVEGSLRLRGMHDVLTRIFAVCGRSIARACVALEPPPGTYAEAAGAPRAKLINKFMVSASGKCRRGTRASSADHPGTSLLVVLVDAAHCWHAVDSCAFSRALHLLPGCSLLPLVTLDVSVVRE